MNGQIAPTCPVVTEFCGIPLPCLERPRYQVHGQCANGHDRSAVMCWQHAEVARTAGPSSVCAVCEAPMTFSSVQQRCPNMSVGLGICPGLLDEYEHEERCVLPVGHIEPCVDQFGGWPDRVAEAGEAT